MESLISKNAVYFWEGERLGRYVWEGEKSSRCDFPDFRSGGEGRILWWNPFGERGEKRRRDSNHNKKKEKRPALCRLSPQVYQNNPLFGQERKNNNLYDDRMIGLRLKKVSPRESLHP